MSNQIGNLTDAQVCLKRTIVLLGMMIECMAGKSASMHGLCHDATPFTFAEDKPAIDHFGQLLTKGSFYLIIAVLSYNIISMP